jgi:hypothetical protein
VSIEAATERASGSTVADTTQHEACSFGHPGDRFWVTADGITSPIITWPTP